MSIGKRVTVSGSHGEDLAQDTAVYHRLGQGTRAPASEGDRPVGARPMTAALPARAARGRIPPRRARGARERRRHRPEMVPAQRFDRAAGPPGNAIPPGDLNAENDRADGRASFLRAPDTVAPPVALEPDNSPYRSPRSLATKRFQPASNFFSGALGPSSAAACGVGKTPRCRLDS